MLYVDGKKFLKNDTQYFQKTNTHYYGIWWDKKNIFLKFTHNLLRQCLKNQNYTDKCNWTKVHFVYMFILWPKLLDWQTKERNSWSFIYKALRPFFAMRRVCRCYTGTSEKMCNFGKSHSLLQRLLKLTIFWNFLNGAA